MLGIYYSNAWGARSLPFMSTRLLTAEGKRYPTKDVFKGGVLDPEAFAAAGVPQVSGSFAYAMLMANAAIGALIFHCILFWGGDVIRAYKSARAGRYDDRHHAHMAKHYKEAPWWWYIGVLILSFVLGLIVVTTQNITLPPWAYIVSLLLGSIIAPFVSGYAHVNMKLLCYQVANACVSHRARYSTLDTATALRQTTCLR